MEYSFMHVFLQYLYLMLKCLFFAPNKDRTNSYYRNFKNREHYDLHAVRKNLMNSNV